MIDIENSPAGAIDRLVRDLDRSERAPGGEGTLGELVDAVFSIGRLQGARAAAEFWCERMATLSSTDVSRVYCRYLARQVRDPIDETTATYVNEWCALQRAISTTGTRLETPSEIEGWFRLAGKAMRPVANATSGVASGTVSQLEPQSPTAKQREAQRIRELLGLK